MSDSATVESLDKVVYEMEGGDVEEVKDDSLQVLK